MCVYDFVLIDDYAGYDRPSVHNGNPLLSGQTRSPSFFQSRRPTEHMKELGNIVEAEVIELGNILEAEEGCIEKSIRRCDESSSDSPVSPQSTIDIDSPSLKKE
jgi:hypothetical protein